MTFKRSEPPRTGLTLELSYNGASKKVLLVLSVAGREGTVSREWGGACCPGLTVPVMDDISSVVGQAVSDWCLLLGVQESLL